MTAMSVSVNRMKIKEPTVCADDRLKSEYGGVKIALEYCVAMNMNKSQAALFLGIDRSTLRERAKRFNVTFPCGYKTRDMSLANEINGQRMTAGNRNGSTGARRRWGV